jgi:competence protein ComEA
VVDRFRDVLRFSAIEIGVLTILALLVIGGACLAWVRARPVELSAATGQPSSFAQTEATTQPSPVTLIIHVVGAVLKPGVYELAPGARGIDAIRAAGGLGPHADATAINLAAPLTDGSQLIVPRNDGKPAAGSTSDQSDTPESSKVNLNTADLAELDSLPGIGPTIAQRIIDYRESIGAFTSIEDLLDVSGIGDKTLEDLRPYVTV